MGAAEFVEVFVVDVEAVDVAEVVVGEGWEFWCGENGEEGGEILLKFVFSVGMKTGIGDSESISQSLPLSLVSPPDRLSFCKIRSIC